MAKGKSRIRPWLYALLAVLGLALLAVLLAWVFRRPIAAELTKRWCAGEGFECSLQVSAIELSHIEVRDLRMTGANSATPLEAALARVELEWPGFGVPKPTEVTILAPVLRGRYAPNEEPQFVFGGLETLAQGGGSPSTDLPAIKVSDARIEMETPAGPVVLTGTFEGQLPFEGTLKAEIEPVELETDGNRLTLSEGRVDVSFVGLKIDGTASLNLAEAAFEGLSVRSAALSMEVTGQLQPQIDWSASVEALSWRDISIAGSSLTGTLQTRLPGPGKRDGLLADIKSLVLSGQFSTLETPQLASGPSDITVDMQRQGRDALEADFALRSEAVRAGPARAGKLTVSGRAQLDDAATEITASGDLTAEGAALDEALRHSLRASLSPVRPVEAHASALAAWLDQAMSAFSLGTGFNARWAGGQDWSVVSADKVTVRDVRGATASLTPQDTHPALNISDGTVEAAGVFDLSGGTAPRITALVRSARLNGGKFTALETGGVSIRPWTAGGLTLAADLNEISLDNSGSVPRLKTVGEIQLDGPLYGLTFEQSRVFGGFDAVFDSSGVRIQAHRTRCLGFSTSGIVLSGSVSVGETALQLCPVDGRIVRQSAGIASGAFELGSVSVPFDSNSTAGVLELEEATLAWRAGQKAALTIEAGRMSLPLEIGGKTLVITSASPTLGLESGDPAELTANVGYSSFAGDILPADLSLANAKLEARLVDSGLQGAATASTVEMRDRGTDPLYEPLTGELSAEFLKGVMTLRGPVTTPRAGRTIANVDLTLDLGTLDGEGRITTPRLTFAPGRLQPTAISERVRGFLSNARGTLEAEALFVIDGGKPAGSGWVSATDFAFDTLGLGTVEGVNGQIEFDNVLAPSTPPSQQVKIGQINPGIPLSDGVVTFQLLSGTQAILEEARWPFSGGEISVDRTTWTMGGASNIVSVTASSLELSQLIDILSLDDIKANGTVSGNFPVEIEGPNAFIRGATLKADQTGGTIAYTGKAGDSAAKADERVKMAFSALRDFRFSVLEIGADGNLSGDILVTMKLVGRSPNVLDGAAFAFNIGIDSKLMQLIQTTRNTSGRSWLAEAVAQSVAQDEATGPADPEDSE